MDDSELWLFTLCEQPFFIGDYMDNELYLCEVEPDCLKFLHKIDSQVSVKYVVPLTSQTTIKRMFEEFLLRNYKKQLVREQKLLECQTLRLYNSSIEYCFEETDGCVIRTL